jgi:hypothetical protein
VNNNGGLDNWMSEVTPYDNNKTFAKNDSINSPSFPLSHNFRSAASPIMFGDEPEFLDNKNE